MLIDGFSEFNPTLSKAHHTLHKKNAVAIYKRQYMGDWRHGLVLRALVALTEDQDSIASTNTGLISTHVSILEGSKTSSDLPWHQTSQ